MAMMRLIVRSSDDQTWTREIIPASVPFSADEAEIRAAIQSAFAYSGVVIGRRPNSFIVLNDPSISGHHCQLVVARPPLVKRSPTSSDPSDDAQPPTPRVFITDTSTNGTYVDGRRLRRNHPTLVSFESTVALGRDTSEAATFSFRISVIPAPHSSAPVDLATSAPEEEEPAPTGHRATTLTSRLATAREERSPGRKMHQTPPRSRWGGCCSTTQSTMSGSGLIAAEAPASASRTSGSSRLAEVIKRLQEENAKKDDEIADIAEELDCVEHSRNALKDENGALLRQVAALEDRVAHAEQATDEAKAAAADNLSRAAALAAQLDRLHASRATASAEASREAATWKEKAMEWEAQSNTASRRLEAALGQLQEAFQDRQMLRSRVSELAAQLEEAEHKQRQATVAAEAASAETAAIARAAEAAACDAAAREDRLDHQLKQALAKLRNVDQAQAKAAEENAALRRELNAAVSSQRQQDELLEQQENDLRKLAEAAQAHREALENNRRLSVTLSELARQTYAMARSLSEEKLPPHYDVARTPPTTRMKITPDTDAGTTHAPNAQAAGALFQKAALLSRCCEESPGTWPMDETPPLRPKKRLSPWDEISERKRQRSEDDGDRSLSLFSDDDDSSEDEQRAEDEGASRRDSHSEALLLPMNLEENAIECVRRDADEEDLLPTKRVPPPEDDSDSAAALDPADPADSTTPLINKNDGGEGEAASEQNARDGGGENNGGSADDGERDRDDEADEDDEDADVPDSLLAPIIESHTTT